MFVVTVEYNCLVLLSITILVLLRNCFILCFVYPSAFAVPFAFIAGLFPSDGCSLLCLLVFCDFIILFTIAVSVCCLLHFVLLLCTIHY